MQKSYTQQYNYLIQLRNVGGNLISWSSDYKQIFLEIFATIIGGVKNDTLWGKELATLLLLDFYSE